MEKFLSKYIGKRLERLQFRRDLKVAFDVDLTLIDESDRPIYQNLAVLTWFIDRGFDVLVWSGGGVSYAEMWVRRLGFEDIVRVVEKGGEEVDIAFDDEAADLGTVTVMV